MSILYPCHLAILLQSECCFLTEDVTTAHSPHPLPSLEAPNLSPSPLQPPSGLRLLALHGPPSGHRVFAHAMPLSGLQLPAFLLQGQREHIFLRQASPDLLSRSLQHTVSAAVPSQMQDCPHLIFRYVTSARRFHYPESSEGQSPRA